MQKLNLSDVKSQLSTLIANVVEKGESYVIARNGQPVARLVPFERSVKRPRIGFMQGRGKVNVPDNFNALHRKEIEDLFDGQSE